MSKKDDYKHALAALFDDFLKSGSEDRIRAYLITNSNLPGRRANLELAAAFADVAAEFVTSEPERLWRFCRALAEISPDMAPVNNPAEFLPFCGTCALGAIGAVSSAFFQDALSRLHELATDPRWRVREAVAMGIQRLLEKQSRKTLKELETWIVSDNWLAMRAVAAGVAEPLVLSNAQTAREALTLHKKIFDRILRSNERKSETFKVLRKGLSYTVSVVVAAIPADGLAYLQQLIRIHSHDPDILWILKNNLKKNRLIKNFPDDVTTLNKLII